MTSPPNAPAIPKRRWYMPTSAKFLLGVLLMQGVLFLSSRFHWFWFNDRKGYTVLITVAATAILLLFLLVSLLVAQLFKLTSQFNLAVLLSSVLAMAIPLGWLGSEIHLARQQRTVIASLQKRGDYVSYQDGLTSLAYIGLRVVPMTKAAPRPALHQYLERILGEDFFNDAYFVSANGANDETLEIVRELRQLRAIQVLNATATDEGMKNLRGLSKLKSLQFDCATYSKPIGDKALEYVGGLSQLEELHLGRSDVTDAGLAHVQGLKRLKGLTISGRGITDDGLLHIAEFKELTNLTIENGHITDQGLSHLAELKELKMLAIYGVGITDAGLKKIRGLSQLEHLDLSTTNITDEGIETLKGFQKLTCLSLYRAKVTDKGIKNLGEALPECQIFRYW